MFSLRELFPVPKKNWRSLIEKMSEISKNSYRKWVKTRNYIKSISSKNQSYGAITEILIDGKVSWQLGVNDTEPWNI